MMVFVKQIKNIAIAISLATLSISTAFAWDGAVSGKVSNVEVINQPTANLDFRVRLKGVPTICNGGTGDFGYTNTSDANYKTINAAVLMAFASNKTVTLYTTKTAAGFCLIGDVIVSD